MVGRKTRGAANGLGPASAHGVTTRGGFFGGGVIFEELIEWRQRRCDEPNTILEDGPKDDVGDVV